MPTGYTTDLTTFDDYLLRCARAFGACMHQRDDDSGSLPKLRTISDYANNRLEDLNNELKRLNTGSTITIAENWLADRIAYYKEAIDRANKLRVKYNAMLNKVNAWVPPTEEHQELKSFMKEQLCISIDGDCSTRYYENGLASLENMSLDEIYDKLVTDCLEDIQYASDSFSKEINSVRKSNEWIKALWESIK